jgi:hypothetical protein
MFVCFAVFIIACGTTHIMEIVNIWHPTYWLSGIIKAIRKEKSLVEDRDAQSRTGAAKFQA